MKRFYLVLEEFDPKKDYGVKIKPQYKKCLSILKKGEKINRHDFINAHLNEFTDKPLGFKSNRDLVGHSFTIGKRIGMLQQLTLEETGYSISYDKFCQLESVKYFIAQLKGNSYKNLKANRRIGTAGTYSNWLWHFNEWLYGKSFEFQFSEQKDQDTFKRIRKTVRLKGLEHFLKLYQDPYKIEQEFIKVIKSYLLEPTNMEKRRKTLKIIYSAIKSYFAKNDYPLNIKIDLKNLGKTTDGDDEQPSMTLGDVLKLLTNGRPTLAQKAIFLCKFHRGLDSSTFADRFNFQAWEQLVSHFGTDEYSKWDLKKCPVPIKLTRKKTDVPHVGFLDIDAVDAIREYLEFREKNKEPMKGGALFLNDRNQPITEEWIEGSFRKLRKNAGLDKELGSYKLQKRYKATAHEFRDLLKSTLIDAGTRPDLADHFIGHAPKDTYEKQATLYPESLRKEYSKASKILNIFSNLESHYKSAQSASDVSERMTKMEDELAKVLKRHERTKNARRKK
ncbi:tyrosine-type recombinase/integrase [Candidatus Nitrosotenuis cloacae]|uniref:tyrosine-type recombinase/integrase n=1 Tax=Candidatus Nitrosotenuis cloacae TaxID=1603555 RepID=UPI0022826C08|nr:tyrosine-type recombinase/integrase [Candidatus Nitrosotenuis cloacae]